MRGSRFRFQTIHKPCRYLLTQVLHLHVSNPHFSANCKSHTMSARGSTWDVLCFIKSFCTVSLTKTAVMLFSPVKVSYINRNTQIV